MAVWTLVHAVRWIHHTDDYHYNGHYHGHSLVRVCRIYGWRYLRFLPLDRFVVDWADISPAVGHMTNTTFLPFTATRTPQFP